MLILQDQGYIQGITEDLKKALNFKDTLSQALINKNLLKEHQAHEFNQERSKFISWLKDQDIKIKSKDIKLKIKIQDHKRAKGTTRIPSWNDPMDFAKTVKAISLPQDVPSTSDRRLIELKNQVQRYMEAYLASKSYVQVNKITSSCEIYSGPNDTQYFMKNPEQTFVDYTSSCTDKEGGLVSSFMASEDARLSKFEADFKQQQGEMTNKINTVLKAIND
ncbi:hypothetical protein Tco_0057788 [Tanacetum coccineum]